MKYFFLLIVPLFFFISASLLKHAQGPYYFGLNDPSYVYLLNSLNLAQLSGYGVGHYDHPGTPVQIIGAMIVKLYFFFTGQANDIVKDAFSRPENYLFLINKFLVLVNTVGLFLLGLFVWRISGNFILGILIQLSPFTSAEPYYAAIDVSPDNFLICVCLCLVGVFVYYLYRIDTKKKPPLIFVIVISILCGLGLATKLNFFPLILVPLIIITGRKFKLLFITLTLLFFFFFILPAVSNIGRMLVWIETLFIHSGTYGSGANTVINPSSFFENILKIFLQNYILFIVLLISVTTLVIDKLKSRGNYLLNERKLLIGLSLAIMFEIILLGKHYHPTQKYLIPAIMLSMISIMLSAQILSRYFHLNLTFLYASIIVLITLWNFWQANIILDKLSEQKNESMKIESFLKNNCSDKWIIPDNESTNPEIALMFATYYAGSQRSRYETILTQTLSTPFYYSAWGSKIISLSDSIVIKDKILFEKEFIIQLSRFSSYENFLKELKNEIGARDISSKKIFENRNGEKIYQVKIN